MKLNFLLLNRVVKNAERRFLNVSVMGSFGLCRVKVSSCSTVIRRNAKITNIGNVVEAQYDLSTVSK